MKFLYLICQRKGLFRSLTPVRMATSMKEARKIAEETPDSALFIQSPDGNLRRLS